MNDIIVIGGNHHNTLGVIRSLGERGLSPMLLIVTTEKKAFVTYSLYLKRTVQIENDDDIPNTLLNEFTDNCNRPVIICCLDSSSGIVDSNRDILASNFILPGAYKQGRISGLMSKKVMADIAIEIGLNIPITCYGNDDNLQIKYINSFIVKPLVSMKGSKMDICICQSWDEVKYHVGKIGADGRTAGRGRKPSVKPDVAGFELPTRFLGLPLFLPQGWRVCHQQLCG